MSDRFNTFWGWVSNPTKQSYWNIFAKDSAYNLLPLVAGYLRSEAYIQYKRDPETYENSEISMDYLFAEALELFKISYYKFFNLVDDGNNLYYSGA
mmetsp:Transcript_4191/g.7109  ORF Transcript_4191/g.7109 Transcript_4191/m.7109 type:complete len:96 (-) Transcript_4191:75-362(-)